MSAYRVLAADRGARITLAISVTGNAERHLGLLTEELEQQLREEVRHA